MQERQANDKQNVKYTEIAKKEREKGKKGENIGIPLPSSWKRMKQFLPNIQPKYYLSASDSGVGKTKLANFLFMYNSLMQYKQGKINDIEIKYYTAEMTIEELVGEAQAFYLYISKGLLTDTDQIYSLGDEKLPEIIDSELDSPEMNEWLDLFQEKVTIITERCSPKFLYKELLQTAKGNGEIITEDINGQDVFKEYRKYNPDKWIGFIYDNFQKTKPHSGQDLRHAIMELSGYFDMARQHFGFYICAMQQVNRTSKSFDRYKLEQFFPSEQDLKDSEAPYHDCQVCLVQISPFKLKLKDFDGYNVDGEKMSLRDRLRAIKIIKNRGGKSYYVNYFMFLGENSYYKEIEYAEDIFDEYRFYNDIYNIKKLVK